MPAQVDRRFKRPDIHENTANNEYNPSYGVNAVSSLPSVAMRIRKAVSEGYKTEDKSLTNDGNTTSFPRVSLPNHLLNNPPSAVSYESTRTLSNLEEWDSYYKINNAPIQTLESFSQEPNYMKRKLEYDSGAHMEPEIVQYHAKYGELHFNDDF
ncbi:DIF1 [Candida oxycetoniae]|uniref:Damage-regulated import facilitator 1 n=1 Tax=Candida oxycetoniae TaxID=497107 RepID=A0AAI9SU99_9ASCO|nr:DIF1 [Candida oxycetoniae]KAI3402624.1 DIF1 [Candida oxycetoniae]